MLYIYNSSMKVVPRRKTEKVVPPVLSSEWIIQNHGDIAACVAGTFQFLF